MLTRILCRTAGLVVLLGATAACAQQLPDFTHLVENNASSVVHVEANYKGETPERTRTGMPEVLPGVPDIFRRFFGQPHPQPGPRMPRHGTSLGSGFIISADGYILTNNHVVEGADSVEVRLQDRRTLEAKVVGTDAIYDIALLKVDAEGLDPVELGNSSDLKPGEWVLAIGSPFGFDYTVTQGIVSAVGRSFGRDQQYVPFIQTDVPINRGNSGGPLFNMDGEVVGINSQIFSNTGGYMGVSFSIPIDIAMDAVRQIKEKGYVSRGMIGVTIQDVDADRAKALGLESASGALIASVNDDSPGDKAGLRPSDVILAYNGVPVQTSSDLPPMVAATTPGETAHLKIMRKGKQQTIDVVIGELPRDENAMAASNPQAASGNPFGIVVEDLSDEQREELDIDAGEGVVIRDIHGMEARRVGLEPGDVILMIGQSTVTSAKDFRDRLEAAKPGSTVMLLVRNRSGRTGFVTLTLPEKTDRN